MTKPKEKKVLQSVLEYQWNRYGGFITAMSAINVTMQALYGPGVEVPQNVLNKVAEEVYKLDLAPLDPVKPLLIKAWKLGNSYIDDPTLIDVNQNVQQELFSILKGEQ